MPDQLKDIQIREACVADAAILAAAARHIAQVPGRLASSPAELPDEVFRERIARLAGGQYGKFIVATLAGEPVGHAVLEPLKLAVTAHVVELTMAVHEGYQGRGLGRRLLSHLLDWARANPRVERVELRVRASNINAITLYKNMGFIEEGRFVNRLKIGPNQYLDDLTMALWVGP